jgi:hypothetical protein
MVMMRKGGEEVRAIRTRGMGGEGVATISPSVGAGKMHLLHHCIAGDFYSFILQQLVPCIARWCDG